MSVVVLYTIILDQENSGPEWCMCFLTLLLFDYSSEATEDC